MRKFASIISTVQALNATDSVVLGANPQRVALTVAFCAANPCIYMFGQVSSSQVGILMPNTGASIHHYTHEAIGDIIQREIHANGQAGASFITFIEKIAL